MAKEKLNKHKKTTGIQPIDYSKAIKYRPLTPEIIEVMMKERDFVPEIKKLESYDDLYYLNMECVSMLVNGKFLESLDKEIKDSIKKLI